MKNLNEIYHIQCIGYCIKVQQTKEKQSIIAIKNQLPAVQKPIKKDSFYFDSNLFVNEPQSSKLNINKEQLSLKLQQQKKQSQQSKLKKQQQIIENKQQKIVKLKLLRNNAFVYSPISSLKKTIKINVKTFFATRKTINIQINITTTIDNFKKLIFQKLGQNILTFYNIRLFYPTYSLIQLSTGTKTIADQMIPQNARLVLLTQQTFTMIPPKILEGLKFSNNNLTIIKTGNSQYSTFFGSTGFQKAGRYYWQIKLDNFQDQEDIFIGVAHKQIDPTLCPTCAGNYWGYMPIFSKKFTPQDPSDLMDYGYGIRLADIIGVLLEFQKGVGYVTFYKNGTSCGTAFSELSGKLYPVVTLFGVSGITQVTIDSKAVCPLSDQKRF